MGTVSSVNPGLSTLLQTLSNSGSSVLSSVLSSPTVASALQKAPPGDVAQLSDQALQLQEVDALFGSPSTSTTPTTLFSSLLPQNSSLGPTNLLQALEQSLASPNSSTTSDATAQANQEAALQSVLQAQQTQALFGVNQTGQSTDQMVNVLA